MSKDDYLRILEEKLLEVARVHTQNSTALARETTIQNAFLDLKKHLEDLLNSEVDITPREVKKTKK